MKTKLSYPSLMLFALLLLFVVTSNAQYGDLPAAKIPPSGWPDLSWQDPGGWVTINVNNNGLPANDAGIDASTIVLDIINNTTGRRILYFPEGDYFFKTDMRIRVGDIRLVGDGSNKTNFILDGPANMPLGLGFSGGEGDGEILNITGNSVRGDQTITIANANTIQTNDYIYLSRNNLLNQLVRVTGKNGNTLTLDMKLGVDFGPANNGTIQEYGLIKNVGVEGVKFKRIRRNGTNGSQNWAMWKVFNGYVSDCFSEFGGNLHFSAAASRDIFFSRNKLHSAFNYGGGGNGYGISFGRSTRVYVVNNKAWNLRHHIIYQNSANHCVIAYNSTENPYPSNDNDIVGHGFSHHNNLIEANMSRKNGSDERSDANKGAFQGLFNTYFRNRVVTNITCDDADDPGNFDPRDYVVVGNIASGLNLNNVNNRFVGLNRINGNVQNGDLNGNSVVPNSLYLNAQPDFLEGKPWPIFGPGVANYGFNNTLPANDRDRQVFGETVLPPTNGTTTYEAENLVRASGGAATSLGGAGTWVNLNADSANDWVEFTLPNIAPGTYRIEVNIQKFNNAGRARTSVEDINLGDEIDFFTNSPSADPFAPGNHTFATAGNKKVRFTITGKNANSTGFKIGIDKIILTSTTTGGGGNSSASFFLVNRGSGDRFRPDDCSGVDDESVRIMQVPSTNAGDCVQWETIDTDNGWFYLKNMNSGKYIRPNGCSQQDDESATIRQVPTTNDGTCTQWRKVETDNGWFYLQNRATVKYIRPLGGVGTDNETIPLAQVPTSFTGNWTQFKFVQVGTNLRANITLNNNDEELQSGQFALYPNPAKNYFTLNIAADAVEEADINIYDLSGRMVLAVKRNLYKGNNDLEIDITTLPNGTYIMKLKGREKLYNQLLVVEQ